MTKTTTCMKGVVSVVFLMTCILGLLILCGTAVTYLNPRTHTIVDAFAKLLNISRFFGLSSVVSLIMSCCGSFGFFYTVRENTYKLGIQICCMLGLLGVIGVWMITTWSEFHYNIEYGLSYAIQGYNPVLESTAYVETIQREFQCCGAKGPRDYDIANENFLKQHVPISCCDEIYHNTSLDKDICHISAIGHQIPANYSYPVGCIEKLHLLVLPTILGSLGGIFGLIVLNVLLSVVYSISLELSSVTKSTNDVNKYRLLHVGEISEYVDSSELGLISLPPEIDIYDSHYTFNSNLPKLFYQCSSNAPDIRQ